MPVNAVLFDLDGVLIDSEPVWERVRREFIERRGGHWSHDLQKRMMGVNTATWSGELSAQLGGTLSPAEVAGVVIAELAASYEHDLPQIDGAAAAVGKLSERFRLGLASGSPRVLIDLTLRLAGLTECFPATVSADEVNRGKPSPDAYLAVARRLGVEPAGCVVVEDSTNGMRAALAAKMRLIAIPRGKFVPDEKTVGEADAVLDDISALTPELILSMP